MIVITCRNGFIDRGPIMLLFLLFTEWMRDSHYLQKWFQKQLEPYKNLVKIHDLTTSFRNGLALSALIHKYRPELL